MKSRHFAFAIMLIGASAFSTAGRTQQNVCDKFLDHKAPKNWNELNGLYKQFSRCDDGAIAEGFSEDVAQLFIKQWTHLDELQALIASDKSFKQFVLRHIDATLSEKELKIIVDKSKSHCPSGKAQFCHQVQAVAERSLKEL